jgi:very-short-patch-repair endonuclease
MSSIYDIGRQAFGDAVRLVEHFRSVPEIIGFSNQLSYEGKIRPLRASSATQIKPACVALKVVGRPGGDVNPREAEANVSLIKAMTKHPAYAGKTIGVISMVKEDQALLIQSLLHKRIDSVELERRRILAGISAEFQGDERDVMFLSLVDSSPGDESTLRTLREGAFELVKKRYNVAASRARDQIWVVHSFDADRDLKPDDLRFQLLQHAKDPASTLRASRSVDARPESPLEQEVVRRLREAGYHVNLRMNVGHFRIGMVVEGEDEKRLAVECDGDRYSSLESLTDDAARQGILERLGWQFVRIRATAFYRDPDGALRRVFDRLQELGIEPMRDGDAPSEDASAGTTLIEDLEGLRASEAGAALLPAPAQDAGGATVLPAKVTRRPRRLSRKS